MSGRVILFGATGYTGELTARTLVASGIQPVLAARSEDRVSALADELGGLETAVADVTEPSSIAKLLSPGDALITTVGPFSRLGLPALEAAIKAGAHYVDSTGEPEWIRTVFERTDQIQRAGIAALTAFGYDYVPGNLAGALALSRAGDDAVRVDVGYFFKGGFGASGGTKASLAGALLTPGHQWANGQLKTTYGATSDRSFITSAGKRTGLAIGSSEHFAIPRIAPQVADVGAYLGWFGNDPRPAKYGSAILGAATRVPGVRPALGALLAKAVPGSTGGPTEAERAKSRSLVVAEAIAVDGRVLERVELEGPNGYDLTASFLSWAGSSLAAADPAALGALGPAEPFGLEALATACAAAGLTEV